MKTARIVGPYKIDVVYETQNMSLTQLARESPPKSIRYAYVVARCATCDLVGIAPRKVNARKASASFSHERDKSQSINQ